MAELPEATVFFLCDQTISQVFCAMIILFLYILLSIQALVESIVSAGLPAAVTEITDAQGQMWQSVDGNLFMTNTTNNVKIYKDLDCLLPIK